MKNPHCTALIKILERCAYRHHMHRVFADFVELSAITVSSAFDLMQRARREERYLQIISAYEPDEQKLFPHAFAELVSAFEVGPADHLGTVFGELAQGNSAVGQFFTPYELCRLLAEVTVGDGEHMRREIHERGFVLASEPAVGAGAQIIALAEAMHAKHLNYQQHLHVIAVDVDSRAVHMAFLQFSFMHIPAVVVLGNTLTLEERELWFTPAHILGLWDIKRRRGYALGSEMDANSAVTAHSEPKADLLIGQLSLGLDEVAA